MYERLVVTSNPNSTRASRVANDVIGRLRDENIHFTHISTRFNAVDDNIADLTPKIHPGDRILPAGGDGTVLALTNAVLDSEAPGVSIGPLAYGNFNDIAGHQTDPLELTTSNVHRVQHTPLSIEVNGELWRYSPAYATLGFTALAAQTFESQESRNKLRSLPRIAGMALNVAQLGDAYFELRNAVLPEFHTSSSHQVRDAVTDVLFLNHRRAGRIIGSATDYGQSELFGYVEKDVRKILPNIPFGLAALAGHAPARQLFEQTISFDTPARIPIQTDGEFALLENVSSIRVSKDSDHPITLLRPAKRT